MAGNPEGLAVLGRHDKTEILIRSFIDDAVTVTSRSRPVLYMRVLLRVSIPVEAGNVDAKAGTLGSTIERILGDPKPEAAYFFADDSG